MFDLILHRDYPLFCRNNPHCENSNAGYHQHVRARQVSRQCRVSASRDSPTCAFRRSAVYYFRRLVEWQQQQLIRP